MTAPAMPPAGDLLTVTVIGDADCRQLRAVGEVATSSGPELAAAVDAALPDRPRRVLMDMSAVTFLGAAAVHAPANGQRRATDAGVWVHPRATRPAVRWQLQVSSVGRLLDAEGTPAGAGA